ncbi:DgyrCDS4331 [Dimorphilus gyrociliatus]|uniref:DgyrCDS4331 n=1 Tax=Dimorphilus gyrociliatus TaxID=2664684 RepID=A0A7I8VGC4_9ANNE|nr:DgyrCDS4331 [Dimorphilus gyrociliatus]
MTLLERFSVFFISAIAIGCVSSLSSFDEYYKHFQDNSDYIERERMYPYNETYFDTNIVTPHSSEKGIDPKITWSFPFYGINYPAIWISHYGHIAFSRNKPAKSTPYAKEFPNPDYPKVDDFPFIAPFFERTDFHAQQIPRGEFSKLYYRLLDEDDDVHKDITKGMLKFISRDVVGAIPNLMEFEATKGIVVTWHQVSFTSVTQDINSRPRNSFQLALVTDEKMTFAVINYLQMSWYGAVENGCNPDTGTSQDSNKKCKPANMGMNAGKGRQFTKMPYSENPRMIQLPLIPFAGSNVTGRFYYRVDDDMIITGGCSSDKEIQDDRPLQTVPSFTHMLGGNAIAVSGPCYRHPEKPQCSFDQDDYAGYVMGDDTSMKAYCISPPLTKLNKLNMEVSARAKSISFKSELEVGRFTLQQPQVKVSGGENWLDSTEISLEWDKDAPGFKDQTIKIVLMGYREDGSSYELKKIHTLANDIKNTGKFSFSVDDHQCKNIENVNNPCRLFDIGAFTVWRSSTDVNNPLRMWSHFIPLGWFIKTFSKSDRGSDWAKSKCQAWHSKDIRDRTWRTELDPCPCTIQQAKADFGRFQPDPYCQENNKFPENCARHTEAVHCVRSTQSTKSGAGSHCCYGQDGELLYSGDSLSGSTSDRAHESGKEPYGEPPYIPTLSHAFNEIAPYYLCCVYANNDGLCFDTYMKSRPTADCKNYKPPQTSAVYGDPHFLTWEDVEYTFNGNGEFWLIKTVDSSSNQIELQARLERLHVQGSDDESYFNASGVTAIALKDGGGSQIHIGVNPEKSRKKLQVYVDGVERSFVKDHLWWQDFSGVSIINFDRESESQNNLTVYTVSGVGLQVSYFQPGLLSLVVSAPEKLRNKIQGLLGKWDNDPSNDLMPQNQGGPVNSNNRQQIHFKFGLTWQITDAQTLFQYRMQKNWNYYKRGNFTPSFEIPTGAPDASDICGNDFECKFDYAITRNEALAQITLRSQKRVEEIRSLANSAPKYCSWLAIPMAIKESPIRYYVGSRVIIKGCRSGYKLDGRDEYTCEEVNGEARWSPSVTTECKIEEEAEAQKTALAIAISVPVGVVLILGIILAIVIFCLCRRKMKEKPFDEQKEADIAGSDVIKVVPVVDPKHEISLKPNLHSYSEYDTAGDTTFTSVEISPTTKRKEAANQQNNNSPIQQRKPRPPLINNTPVWSKPPPSEASSEYSVRPVPRSRPDLKTEAQPEAAPKPYPTKFGNGKSQEEPLLNSRPPPLHPKPNKKPRPNLNKSQESLC